MPDYQLIPRTAFGDDQALVTEIGAAKLTERPDFSIASVSSRAGQGDISSALTKGDSVGVSQFVHTDDRCVFWTGPDQWFVMGDHATEENLAQSLSADLGSASTITKQNDGWVVFDLTGDNLNNVLERLCLINLAAFSAGSVQRTVIEHIGCYVLCLDKNTTYRLLCGRSYAVSFAHAIIAMLESVAAQECLGS